MAENSLSLKAELEYSHTDISLRLFELSDVGDFMVWATDDRVGHFLRTVGHFQIKEDVSSYLDNKIKTHPWYRAICLKNRPIGAISVCPGTGNEMCRADIGYALGSTYWGKGIATVAVKMVIASVFREWPFLQRLQGLVDAENVGSQKVLEKAGFVREAVLRKYWTMKGQVRDVVIYSIVYSDLKHD